MNRRAPEHEQDTSKPQLDLGIRLGLPYRVLKLGEGWAVQKNA